MPAVGRQGDKDEVDNINMGGSSNVFINNKPAHRVSDKDSSFNVKVEGSKTVLVNGVPLTRVGDKDNINQKLKEGSPNVFAGGPVTTGGGDPTSNGPETSTLFAGLSESPKIQIDSHTNTIESEKYSKYLASPQHFTVTADDNGYHQVKERTAATPNVSAPDNAPPLPPADFKPGGQYDGAIKAFLDKCLAEAKQDKWTEWTDPPNKLSPSNPNIIGIWKYLGFPQSGMWISDSTAWCMGFVCFVLKACNYNYYQTAGAAMIKNATAKFQAQALPPNVPPQPGDIVLWQYGSHNHVNFVYTYDSASGKMTFVGGNQSGKSNNNNNPSNGQVTQSYPGGVTRSFNKIIGIYRPSKRTS